MVDVWAQMAIMLLQAQGAHRHLPALVHGCLASDTLDKCLACTQYMQTLTQLYHQACA